MIRLRTNFVGGTVDDNPLTIGATTLNSTELVGLPVVTAAQDYIALILDPTATYGDPEIVYVTAHTTLDDAATISRGEEGTTARAHVLGTEWVHAPTAEDWNQIVVNTDGDPGHQIFVGVIDPDTDYALEVGDVWIRMP